MRKYKVTVSNKYSDYEHTYEYEAEDLDHAVFMAGTEHALRHISASDVGLLLQVFGIPMAEITAAQVAFAQREYEVIADYDDFWAL